MYEEEVERNGIGVLLRFILINVNQKIKYKP